MNTIKKQIKAGQFSPYYVLYGSEEYLKSLYLNKLVHALLAPEDTMNLSVYEGNRIDMDEVLAMANTLPFFSERRVVVLKNTGLFKSATDIGEHLANIPDSTTVLFVEKEVDKRSKLFQFVRDHGYATEMNGLGENDLRLFVASGFKKFNLLISNNTIDLLLSRCGTDMVRLTNEIEKLAAYCQGKGEVQPKDLRTITTVVAEGHVFAMIDAVSAGDKKRAVSLYSELLAAQEKPMRILQLLAKNYYQLSLVLKMSARGIAAADIADKLSMKPFVVNKFLRNNRNTSISQIMDAISYGNELEYAVKIGNLDEHIAVEMYLLRLCEQKKQKNLAK